MRLSGLPLTINATTVVAAAPWQVFEFLDDPLNESLLADRLGRAGRAELRLLEPEPNRCPLCTERVPDDAELCSMCGADLRALRPGQLVKR